MRVGLGWEGGGKSLTRMNNGTGALSADSALSSRRCPHPHLPPLPYLLNGKDLLCVGGGEESVVDRTESICSNTV